MWIDRELAAEEATLCCFLDNSPMYMHGLLSNKSTDYVSHCARSEAWTECAIPSIDVALLTGDAYDATCEATDLQDTQTEEHQ